MKIKDPARHLGEDPERGLSGPPTPEEIKPHPIPVSPVRLKEWWLDELHPHFYLECSQREEGLGLREQETGQQREKSQAMPRFRVRTEGTPHQNGRNASLTLPLLLGSGT